MKRFLLGLASLVLLLVALAYAFRAPLTLRVMDRVVARNMTSSLLDVTSEGLHLVLCGAGSPLPDPKRGGPCVAVIAGEQLVIVDSGSGASRVMSRVRIPQGEIDAILLTHFHSDHIDGLGEVLLQRWANGGSRTPLPVHGPTGVERVVNGINEAYALSRVGRVAHHGEDVVPSSGAGGVARPFPVPAEGEGVPVLETGGLRVTAFLVDHAPVEPAVGYRFDYAGRSLVISGDTVKSANLVRFASDADLLVHEALSPRLVERLTLAARAAGNDRLAKITTDILDYHTTPVEAAEVAREARVGHLLFYHVVPPLPLPPLEEIFVEGVDQAWDGPVTLGRDGTWVRLPPGSDAIEVEEL
jgi:ribonuclease Z